MTYDRRKYDGFTIEEKVDEALSLLDAIINAFPDGTENHREAHQAMINAKKAEEEFWLGLKNKLVERGIIAVIYVLLALMGVGILVKAKEFLK